MIHPNSRAKKLHLHLSSESNQAPHPPTLSQPWITNNKAIYTRQRPSRFMLYACHIEQTYSPLHVAGSFVRGIWIFDPGSQDESLKEHQRKTCTVTLSRLWSQGYIPRHIYGPPKQDKSITTYSSSYKSDINLIPFLPICPDKH